MKLVRSFLYLFALIKGTITLPPKTLQARFLFLTDYRGIGWAALPDPYRWPPWCADGSMTRLRERSGSSHTSAPGGLSWGFLPGQRCPIDEIWNKILTKLSLIIVLISTCCWSIGKRPTILQSWGLTLELTSSMSEERCLKTSWKSCWLSWLPMSVSFITSNKPAAMDFLTLISRSLYSFEKIKRSFVSQ